MRLDGDITLTYCGNVHPAGSADELFENLRVYTAGVRERVCQDEPFALGLHVPASVAGELLNGRLDECRDIVRQIGCEVATMNGFPFANFQGRRIKSSVFAPDWRDRRRTDYTLTLARLLHALAPAGREAGISTVPLSFAAWHADAAEGRRACVPELVAAVAGLARLEEATGRRIHLDIEPEPAGLLETSRDIVAFYQDVLLLHGAPMLAGELGCTMGDAELLIRRHLRICYDTCHAAVVFEEPYGFLRRMGAAGISVGKVQISSALRCQLPASTHARRMLGAALEKFSESYYLHQVMGRNAAGNVTARGDLADALKRLGDSGDVEWRIHYHVPLFVADYGMLTSTRRDAGRALFELKQARFTDLVEIETYTWAVLPPGLKTGLVDSIAREYEWVREQWEEYGPVRMARAA